MVGMAHLLIVFSVRHSNRITVSKVTGRQTDGQTDGSVFLHGPGGGAHVSYRKKPSKSDQKYSNGQEKNENMNDVLSLI